jgi:hypothetical protein
LKRAWGLIQRTIADYGASVGINASLISDQCDPGADVNAIFFGAALLQHLFQSGLLNDWREGNEPSGVIFQLAATFPMEQGVQGFDPGEFIERLRSEKP